MARLQGFRIGVVDKAFRNVKTEKGWKPVRKFFDAVNPRLKENRRHIEEIRNFRATIQ